jgi:archaellum biogenesis ATPase FlaH
MSDVLVSAAGERAAMGGYVPQFNEFARFAYRELISNNLEWIKIADPEAEKLDDIQYATLKEVHAYQVKWTIADQTVSYLNFTELLPLVIKSWQSLKAIHAKDSKRVIAHLLTNKMLSQHDSIKFDDEKVGTFSEFYNEVWLKWKSAQPVDKKWDGVIKELIADTGLPDAEFEAFIAHFEFQPEHEGKEIKVGLRAASPEVDDLLTFRSFLLEKVADPARQVPFTGQEIIKELLWEARFKTTFNHELFVDKNRYQSISSTINDLNDKLSSTPGGYLFLVGGPGTGKSTLLTAWMKGRSERVIKYYAFDFTNPSSTKNYQDRGDSTTLYFDLVFQLKYEGFYQKSVLPYRDLNFLKGVFADQLAHLGDDFKAHRRKTIIVIDGLDHVPREYKSVAQSFLRDLPLPSELPEGVYIILGSQSYELEDLAQEIKAEWKGGDRTIMMNPLDRMEVFSYAEKSQLNPELTESQKQALFEKSQGHPLYLSYLTEKVRVAENRDQELSDSITIDGDIDIYYRKMWEPIQNNAGLIDMLGLMARVNGSINIDFVSEWNLARQTLHDFRKDAKLLFDEGQHDWTFFHNSFRQFLLYESAKNPLTDVFDQQQDINNHKRLAELYSKSAIEPAWKQNFHLYHAKAFDEFLAATSPEAFFDQLVNFRPSDEIRRDIKLGMEIALKTHNVFTLLQYLFAMAELDRRIFNVEPASYVEEFLQLDKNAIAKRYVRNGANLLVSSKFGLQAARWFYWYGDKQEGAYLFGLAEPEMITDDGIVLDYRDNIDRSTCEHLQEWVTSAILFRDHQLLLKKITAVAGTHLPEERLPMITPQQVKALLQRDLAIALINEGKWEAVEDVTAVLNLADPTDKNNFFHIMRYAANDAVQENDFDKASRFLIRILNEFEIADCSNRKKIAVADLILKIEKDKDLAEKWLNDVTQPLLKNSEQLGFRASFHEFHPLIKLNKLLNLLGRGVPITEAVPTSAYSADDQIIVEYQRMICLTTQILCEGIEKKPIYDLSKRIRPIMQFYNRPEPRHNSYWYKLGEIKTDYFDFLIQAVAHSGEEQLEKLIIALTDDFQTHSAYWKSEDKRGIINSLINVGLDHERAKAMLMDIEVEMLTDKDIDGRITACMKHAASFILLDDKQFAEQWIKRGITESIGVGYRKDYQFNTWIDWLKVSMKNQPGSARENIRWFLSHLRHLKESTEGRAFELAAKKMLKTTLDWNFEAGIEQLKWQLNSAMIDFEDAIETLISCYVSRTDNKHDYEVILPVYYDIYLYLAVDAGTSLLKTLLKKGHALYSSDFFTTHIPAIYNGIITRSLDEHRPDLLAVLERFLQSCGVSATTLIPDFTIPDRPSHHTENKSSNTLIIGPDYTQVSEEDVLNQVDTFDQFKELLEKEDKANLTFDWTKVFGKVKDSMTAEQVREAAAIVTERRKPTDLLINFSELALELGEKELAKELIEHCVAHASTMGWMTYYDGGSRLKAFKALQKVTGDDGVKVAFEVFTQDVTGGESSGMYAENLDEILPVIAPGYDENAVWNEVFAYLKRLMSTSTPITELPELNEGDKTIYECLTNLLVYFAGYDVSLLSAAAVKILAKQLSEGHSYVTAAIAAMPIVSDASAELFIGILLAASACGASPDAFTAQLETLAISSNFLVRAEARHLLQIMGLKPPSIPETKLPAFYDLELSVPGLPKPTKGMPAAGHSLAEIRELIKPFGPEVKILANMSGMSQETLLYRVNHFMNAPGRGADWNSNAAEAFRQHLEDIRLKYGYPKPRVLAAKRAILKVVAELVDAKQLDPETVSQLFNLRDKKNDFSEISVRPSFIKPLGEKKYMLSSTDWTSNLNNNERLIESLLKTKDGLHIIAEYTLLKSLNWGRASQTYMSQIKATDEQDDKWFIFGSAFNELSENYHDSMSGANNLIIIREHRSGSVNLQSTWIAFNPMLVRFLGWQPLEGKLFAWADSEGRLMVESVYWMDGNVSMQPPHLYSEAGEGWYVAASDEALAEIQSVEPDLFFERFLHRSAEEDKIEDQISVIDPLIV